LRVALRAAYAAFSGHPDRKKRPAKAPPWPGSSPASKTASVPERVWCGAAFGALTPPPRPRRVATAPRSACCGLGKGGGGCG